MIQALVVGRFGYSAHEKCIFTATIVHEIAPLASKCCKVHVKYNFFFSMKLEELQRNECFHFGSMFLCFLNRMTFFVFSSQSIGVLVLLLCRRAVCVGCCISLPGKLLFCGSSHQEREGDINQPHVVTSRYDVCTPKCPCFDLK